MNGKYFVKELNVLVIVVNPRFLQFTRLARIMVTKRFTLLNVLYPSYFQKKSNLDEKPRKYIFVDGKTCSSNCAQLDKFLNRA